MPLDPFSGTTFVAYMDISGFRKMMTEESRAVRALDCFYQAGYDALHRQNGQPRVDGLFISDCGVLFVRGAGQGSHAGLQTLLDVVERINREVLASKVMLTTSIAHGSFSYHNRLEFPGIEKNPAYGNAYVSAFLDNERGNPRIQPGKCRIVRRPAAEQHEAALATLSCPRLRVSRVRHAYFFWMVRDGSEIAAFEKRYHDAYSLKDYKGMLEALRSASNPTVPPEQPRRE
ncbi:MAG: hypothetical protein NT151_09310 [Acidobacteria bacterium]|nr:hypothetical protein [Acidobacteriota bacterium]